MPTEPSPFSPRDLYVSPAGKDNWSGTLPEPNAGATDGPLATLARAQSNLRTRRQQALDHGPATVWLREGRYRPDEPLAFGPEDSGPATYRGYPGETAVIDGGVAIDGWREETVSGQTVWVADVPEVAAGRWDFRQLFVDGLRCRRARLPKEDYYRIREIPGIEMDANSSRKNVSTQFRVEPGQFSAAWKNLTDVEVVAVHYWVDEHMPLAAYDEETQLVTVAAKPWHNLIDDVEDDVCARYYIENVFEALERPGDWYLDRPEGKLYYVPASDQAIEGFEAVAPKHKHLLVIEGDPDSGRTVDHLRFEDLSFEHAAADTDDYQTHGGGQAANTVPGAIQMTAARHCALENCRVAHVGGYAVELADGCSHVRVVGCEITDLGAGGIKLNGSNAAGPLCRRNGFHRITDNHVHVGGRIFHSGVGILLQHTSDNVVAHNHVHDFYYSGMSVGWQWNFDHNNVARKNWIEKNHIHDIGQGMLNDMGGIYLLGVQPGTVIKGNLIHDIRRHNYGGWAIYPDEGSSYLVIEDNICYNTSSQPFQQHIGWQNIVRNNIFAFGDLGCVMLSNGWSPDHKSYALEGNILITDGTPIQTGGYWGFFHLKSIISERNVLWDVSGKPLVFREVDAHYRPTKDFTHEQWVREFGHDLCSVVADPKCKDLANFDFTLAEDSPALSLGFRPIDMSDVGPRPRGARDGGPNVNR